MYVLRQSPMEESFLRRNVLIAAISHSLNPCGGIAREMIRRENDTVIGTNPQYDIKLLQSYLGPIQQGI